MAGGRVSPLFWAICLVGLLSHGCLAQLYTEQQPFGGGRRRFGDESHCRLRSLQAQEPSRRVESEAGMSEYWNANDEQFECAGVAPVRHTIQPRGLLLPEFSNSPRLVYIVQGSGISGVVIPGCPETFHSFEQSQKEERPGQHREQHQKIRHFRQGDILAVPAGFSHWCYNNGDTPVIAVQILDTSNYANQLDRNPRKFFLAGRPQRTGWQEGQQEESSGNIFSGFDDEILAEALGVSREMVRKLKSEDDRRGAIVRVERGLQMVGPGMEREERWEEEEEWEEKEETERKERRRRGREEDNGLEETLCNMRLRENIGDPIKADFYSRQGGHITTLNSQKLPVLRYLQLSAERGHLRRNAIVAPMWNINAHSVIYCTRGTARVQIVGTGRRPLYDGRVRRGQMLVVPQAHAVVMHARDEEFEWVAFKTNDNAMMSPLAGRTSVLRGMPADVLVNAYRISREEARRVKFGRDFETVVLGPGRSQEIRMVAE